MAEHYHTAIGELVHRGQYGRWRHLWQSLLSVNNFHFAVNYKLQFNQ